MPPYILLLIFPLLLLIPHHSQAQNDRVKLTDIQTLTLSKHGWTNTRRNEKKPQLRCIGGYCAEAGFTTAQCYNRGSDGRSVQWECRAQMPSQYRFGRLDVSCEGYDAPGDPYVLAGSCSLQYTIETGKPGAAGGPGLQPGPGRTTFRKPDFGVPREEQHEFSFMPIIMFIAICILIYYCCLKKAKNQLERQPSQNPHMDHGATGGGYNIPGGGAQPSAPPPPGFRTDIFGYGQNSYNKPQDERPRINPYARGMASHRNNWGGGGSGGGTGGSMWPGAIGGLAAGGLMGYLFGQSRSNNSVGTNGIFSNDQELPTMSSGLFSSRSSESPVHFGGGGGDGGGAVEEAFGFAGTSVE